MIKLDAVTYLSLVCGKYIHVHAFESDLALILHIREIVLCKSLTTINLATTLKPRSSL